MGRKGRTEPRTTHKPGPPSAQKRQRGPHPKCHSPQPPGLQEIEAVVATLVAVVDGEMTDDVTAGGATKAHAHA